MRRLISPITLVFGLVGVSLGLGGVAAVAAPTPTPDPSAPGGQVATPGKKVCAISDDRLVELSGMVATKAGYVVINDGTDVDSRQKVFFLNGKCKVSDSPVSYSGGGPYDPEDLALSPDGATLWIADIGDNPISPERRKTVALWSMPVDGSKKPVIHRLSYPDGPHDAEALLFNGDGTPIIVTKDAGKSALYAPTAPLQPDTREGVPMEKRGEVKIPKTTTAHRLGAAARMLVTGGATAPGGARVALRTYTDAFEWDVADGDVVAALTTGTPRVTALPDEPLGEAIAYTPDGKRFLTVSETADLEDVKPTILSYTPATKVVSPSATEDDAADEKPWYDALLDKLGLQGLTYLVAVIGVIGAMLVGVGVFGILRARRRKASRDTAEGDGEPIVSRQTMRAGGQVYGDRDGVGGGPPSEADWDYRAGHPHDDYVSAGRGHTSPATGYGPPAAPTVYGGSAAARRGPDGAVYGGQPSGGVYGGGYSDGGPSGNGVYGGGHPGGGVYGGAAGGPQAGYTGDGYPASGYDDGGYPRGGYPDDRAGRGRAGYPDDGYDYR